MTRVSTFDVIDRVIDLQLKQTPSRFYINDIEKNSFLNWLSLQRHPIIKTNRTELIFCYHVLHNFIYDVKSQLHIHTTNISRCYPKQVKQLIISIRICRIFCLNDGFDKKTTVRNL